MKILFTGGHITPAIAVADELHRQLPAAEIIFVGRATALEGTTISSEEARIVRNHGFRFLTISAGRLTRVLTIFSLISVVRIPFGLLQAIKICLTQRPNVIISFGGYIALPMVLAGWLARIPIVTHEQTMLPGLANRIIGRFAKKICVSFPQTTNFFSKTKTIVTGLPIRASLFTPAKKPPFFLESNKPLIFFSGGSTGAQTLNRLIFPVVGLLAERFCVIHQTGRLDFFKAPKTRGYIPIAYLDENNYAWVLNRSSLIVGRSGANTVGEIAALGKVALFVPLPWSAGNEQYENARVLFNAGSAKIFEQKDLTSETLVRSIEDVMARFSELEKNARAFSKTVPTDSAQRVAAIVATIVTNA